MTTNSNQNYPQEAGPQEGHQEPPSKAWLCAQQYDQVLMSYLVCVWHIAPHRARKILNGFLDNTVIRIKLAEESRKAGSCFRLVIQQMLDLFLDDICSSPEVGIEALKNSARMEAEDFFNRAWARQTVAEALRRILFFCRQENRLFLYQTLISDLDRKPYCERALKKPIHEMYYASEQVKVLFCQQLEAVLLQTISDPRLVMQEWQELHHILPDVIALDPEMATQHDLAIQDMRAFWLELLKESVPEIGMTYWAVIHDPKSTVEILQKTRKHIHQQRDISYIPAELREALNYACLASELLKSETNNSNINNRLLARGFFWLSKQKWLDRVTTELAIQAEDKMQQMTVVINE